jgi:hypothetical protein
VLGTVKEVFDRAVDVFVMAVGLGCVWWGWRAVLRPLRSPEPVQGPVWTVRVWGFGQVSLGISLAVHSVTLMAGGEPGRPADVIRWVAGPLVIGSVLAAFLSRRWKHRRARAVNEGRRA